MVIRALLAVLCVAAVAGGVRVVRDPGPITSAAATAVAAAAPARLPTNTAEAVETPIVSAAALASARRYARSRVGSVSFAVVEDRAELRGYRATAGYPSASVVKAMIMVAVLRRAGHGHLTSSERALLYPMITQSDNAAAIALWNTLGADALRRVAKAAGMRRFAIAS